MFLQVQSAVFKSLSVIDKATIQKDLKLAAPSDYTLSQGDTLLTKVGGGSSSSRSFEVTGKPRPGKFFMRVKYNGSNYAVILISPELVNANNQLAWTSGSLPANVWHEVKVEHISGETYRYSVNNVQLYQGTAQHITFYGHTSVTQIEVDTGQYGVQLPAGFAWL